MRTPAIDIDAISCIVRCTVCGEEVEVRGALSLVRDPFKCVLCLSPRLREALQT